MVQINGTPIFPDIAIGKIRFYQEPQPASPTGQGEALERARLDEALRETGLRLAALHEKALREAGEEEAAILEIHQMLLEDEDFLDAVNGRLAEGSSAEHAVRQAGEHLAELFSEMDEYMQARAADIRDVAARLARTLSGAGELELTEPVILMAEDLAPSATIQLDRSMLLGFVTRGGSVNSHTAILSRTLSIPALVQAPIRPEWDGRPAVLDGTSGVLYVDPDEETLAAMERAAEELRQRRLRLQALKGQQAVTKDGRRILTYANVGSLYEVQLALENDAEGIGLFRSEFLYLDRNELPSEEGAVSDLPQDAGADGRAEGHRPDAGYRRGQAGGVSPSGRGGKPRNGLPRHPHLSGPARHLPDTAAGSAAGQRIREPVHHVPHDRLGGRGAGDPPDRSERVRRAVR